MEIILYNIVFWTVYIFICTLPYRVMQSFIDNVEE
jgi:hypothetical protein